MWISVSEILHFLEYPILFLAEDSQTSNFSVNFIVSLFESVQSVLALSNHLLKLIKFISHINEDIGRFRLYELRLFQLFADVFQHSGVLHQLFFKPLYEPCLINLSHLQLMLKSSSILIQLVQQNLSVIKFFLLQLKLFLKHLDFEICALCLVLCFQQHFGEDVFVLNDLIADLALQLHGRVESATPIFGLRGFTYQSFRISSQVVPHPPGNEADDRCNDCHQHGNKCDQPPGGCNRRQRRKAYQASNRCFPLLPLENSKTPSLCVEATGLQLCRSFQSKSSNNKPGLHPTEASFPLNPALLSEPAHMSKLVQLIECITRPSNCFFLPPSHH
mmetsp:Transcript_9391/g.40736  ORF Transcript_9391/g.40736 Transcript_9391/m.40736 type:complete len:332 (-) Transcript_9391:78-1073(-)